MQITVNYSAFNAMIDALNIAIERLSYYGGEKPTIAIIEDAVARAQEPCP